MTLEIRAVAELFDVLFTTTVKATNHLHSHVSHTKSIAAWTIAQTLFASGCVLTPPGEDHQGQIAKDHWNPVLIALVLYKQDRGKFPAKLGELASKYIEAIPPERNGYYKAAHYAGGMGEITIFYSSAAGSVACSSFASSFTPEWGCLAAW